MIKVGILGTGAMGSGIAQVAATAGHEVYLYDAHPDARVWAEENLLRILTRLRQKGKLEEAEANAIFSRFHFVKDLSAFKDAGLVIEAIVENLEIKKEVFRQLDVLTGDDCLLATNTSSLSVSAIASACKSPERVLGIHFFNPAPLMRLVEIIPALQTGEKNLQQARQIIDSWGKKTVLAKDTPGFIVNRIARPFYGEALRIYEEGIADIPTIDWAMKELGGFRMGPFQLMDYIGNDVNYKVSETVFAAFYYDPRYRPSFTQKRLADAGFLGRKSGQGFYDYREGHSNPEPTKDKSLGLKILNRILAMLINEAADAMYLGIASRDDIDMAMTSGVNYPKGLLKWADEIGIRECVRRMDLLNEEYLEDRYRCSPLLRKLARDEEVFYPMQLRMNNE